MKRLVSSRVFPINETPDKIKKEMQIAEIVSYAKHLPELFLEYTHNKPFGKVSIMELWVLEPGEQKDYAEFLQWKHQKKNLPLYSFEIKGTMVNDDE